MSARIIYLAPFPNTQISGGVKVMFRHVEILRELGIDASIYSPHGHPAWISSDAKLYTGPPDPTLEPGTILVFPETLNGPLGALACRKMAAKKVLFCQNQYFMFNDTIPKNALPQLGFARLVTVSHVAKGFLDRVFAPAIFDIVPIWIDPTLFFAQPKTLRIALSPRKLPKEANLIKGIFDMKYPELKSVPWDVIADKTERETAELLGRAAVFVALSELESIGLMPLEAMACGCIVVGFHGYGGLEYATEDNGVWLRPDFLEETADAIARVIVGIRQKEPRVEAMRAAGFATAARYDRAVAVNALRTLYENLET